MNMNILGPLIFTTIFLGAGITMLFKNLYIIRDGTRSTARIVSFSEKWVSHDDGHSTLQRTPIVEFTDNKGKKVLAEIGKFKWQIGDTVEIIYSNKNSSKVIVPSFFQLYIIPLIAIAIGIFGLITFLLPVL